MNNDEKMSRREFVKRASILGGAAVLGPTLLSACGALTKGASGSSRDLLVGLVEPYSGPYAVSGTSERHGAELAVAKFNQNGGMWGKHQVVIKTEDTQTKPNVGADKARKLVEQDKVDFLVGCVSSGVGLAVSSYAQQAGVPYIGSGIHSDTLTGSKLNKLFFRTTISSTMPARTVGKFLLEKGKKWYFLTADYSWGVSNEVAFKKVLQAAGGTIVGTDRTPLGTTDFSAQLTKAKGTDADVIVMSLYGSDLVAALKQFNQFNMASQMFPGGPLNGAEIASALSDQENIGYWGMPWAPDDGSSEATQFAKDISTKYNETVNWRHWCGYNATYFALKVIEQAGTTDPTKFVKTAEGFTWDDLKPSKATMRPWDHQGIQEVYCGQGIPKSEWTFKGQYFKIIGREPGDKVARTKAENPDAAKRLASQSIPKRPNYSPLNKA